MVPAGASSWRGSYQELGLEYSETGGGTTSWNTDEVEIESEYGNCYKEESVAIPEYPTAQDFLNMLKALQGKTMVGYKGGDYTMHKNVAVYVANYGNSGIPDYKGDEYATVAVMGIDEIDEGVIIVTAAREY